MLQDRPTIPRPITSTTQVPGVATAADKAPIEWPALLLPLRLETRRVADTLRIRVFPDQPFIDAHPEALTEEEYSAGQGLVDAVTAGLTSATAVDDARGEWKELARRYGTNRAAWILESRMSHPDAPLTATASAFVPRLRWLPDRFHFLIYHGDALAYQMVGEAIPETLPIFRTVQSDPSPSDETFFDADSTWMTDFGKAVEVGLALEVRLRAEHRDDPTLTFSKIVVVGLRPGGPQAGVATFESFVRSHHYSDGIAFIPNGTPTNNTNTSTSGHSESDDKLLEAFDVEVLAPHRQLSDERRKAGAAARLERALALPAASNVLASLQGAELAATSAVERLFHALWPCTGDYFFTKMLGFEKLSDQRGALAEHVRKHLRPSGTLSALRVGNQPYGVLPTSTTGTDQRDPFRWKAASDTTEPGGRDWRTFDESLHRSLTSLHSRWLDRAEDSSFVPQAGVSNDIDDELIRLLGMLPHSAEYRARPIVDHSMIGVLIRLLWPRFGWYSGFGPWSQQEAQAAWLQEKDAMVNFNERLLSSMGASVSRLAPLLRSFAWGEGGELGMALVRDAADPTDGPEKYLPLLASVASPPAANDSQTLLFDLLRRALSTQGSVPASGEVMNVVLWLQEQPVLEFFNVGLTEDALTALWTRAPALPALDADDWDALVSTLSNGDAYSSRAAVEADLESALEGAYANLSQKIWVDYTPVLEQALRDLIDALTYRLDAWYTSLAAKRIEVMHLAASQGSDSGGRTGVHWGAFGYVEDIALPPRTASGRLPDSGGGYNLAPSVGQATAAAMMRSAYDSHRGALADNAYALNLSSNRVRRAQQLIEGVQSGQSMSALIGYQFERALHDAELDHYIDAFRAAFPIDEPPASADGEGDGDEAPDPAESIHARNVVDGRALIAAWNGSRTLTAYAALGEAHSALEAPEPNSLQQILHGLADANDALGDLLQYEGIFQSAQGNYERSGAAMEACSGQGRPPELQAIDTVPPGINLRHRVCLFLPCTPEPTIDSLGPRATAEPRFNAWISSVLGPLANIATRADIALEDGATADPVEFSIAELDPKLSALDFLQMCAASPDGTGDTELEIRMRRHVLAGGVAPTSAITFALDDAPAGKSTVNDAIEVGRALLDMIGNATVMEPDALLHPDDAPGQTAVSVAEDAEGEPLLFSALEIGNLWQRAADAQGALAEAAADLASADSTKYLEALDTCAGFGIGEALVSGDADTSLEARRVRTIEVANKRLALVGPLLGATKLTDQASLPAIRTAFRELFGEGFLVFPPFDASSYAEKAADFVGGFTTPPANDRVWLWLHQVADTHSRVHKLESMLLTAEAWNDVQEHPHFAGLRVAQLPRRTPLDDWQALSDAELGGEKFRREHCQSIVAMMPESFTLSCVSGLVIDEWTETIPSKQLSAGVSFEYNQPACQAPQCFLLCAPGNFDSATWSAQHLASIVIDTVELAKARLVDLDAYPEVAGVLPALMFPVSAGTPTQSPGALPFDSVSTEGWREAPAHSHAPAHAISSSD
jgi:hypothetical protein